MAKQTNKNEENLDILYSSNAKESSPSLVNLSNEDALKEYFGENISEVTSPSQINYDKREDIINEIRSKIEKLINDKWDIFEYSRLFDTKSLKDTPTIEEVKRALMPYVSKGWYATISFISPKKENLLLTYEANFSFLSSSKFVNRDYQDRIFVRLYPKTPVRMPYIKKAVLGDRLFAIPIIGILAATVVATWIFSALFVVAGISIGAIAVFLLFQMGGKYVALSRKNKPSDKLGPLLWMDDVQGYKTEHISVTREERIKQVIKTRVLAYNDL